MGKGAELCVVSKRNQPIHSKDEQGQPSEEKIIPALRQATKRVWRICRNNVDYAQSYLRPFLILFPHFPYSVKISALSSETTLPKLQTSPGDAMCPFKVVSTLDFTDSRWRPLVLSYLFWGCGGSALLSAQGWRGEEIQLQHWVWIWVFSLFQEATIHSKKSASVQE